MQIIGFQSKQNVANILLTQQVYKVVNTNTFINIDTTYDSLPIYHDNLFEIENTNLTKFTNIIFKNCY
jgi:hypothetical protein